jgi:hypothetical protein
VPALGSRGLGRNRDVEGLRNGGAFGMGVVPAAHSQLGLGLLWALISELASGWELAQKCVIGSDADVTNE